MAYNITLTAGEMAVTFDNGDTAAFNLTTDVSVIPNRYRTFVQSGITPPAVGIEVAIPTITTAYAVQLHFNDGSIYRITMGEVDNQVTWVNTQAGMNLCIAAVQAAFA